MLRWNCYSMFSFLYRQVRKNTCTSKISLKDVFVFKHKTRHCFNIWFPYFLENSIWISLARSIMQILYGYLHSKLMNVILFMNKTWEYFPTHFLTHLKRYRTILNFTVQFRTGVSLKYTAGTHAKPIQLTSKCFCPQKNTFVWVSWHSDWKSTLIPMMIRKELR